jgi:hypothetical protein
MGAINLANVTGADPPFPAFVESDLMGLILSMTDA